MAYPVRVCTGMVNRGYLQLLTKCKAAVPTNPMKSSPMSIRHHSSMLLNDHRNSRCFGSWSADRLGQGTEHAVESTNTISSELKDNAISETKLNDLSESELKHIQNVASTIPQDGEPRLLLSWLCANCGARCAKLCRKKSYYESLVIMRCDECRKWQLMSDHLQWFKDDAFEIEQLLEQNDQKEDPAIRKKIVDIINSATQRIKTIDGESQINQETTSHGNDVQIKQTNPAT